MSRCCKLVALLGASFDTGNLGVSALAEGAVRAVLCRWPDADVCIVGTGAVPGQSSLLIDGHEHIIPTYPLRFCRNVFASNHIVCLIFWGVVARLLPLAGLRRRLALRRDTVGAVFRADIAADLTGGDSFSDIYGVKRLLMGVLRKWAVLLGSRAFVMLPQTHGPFKRRVSKVLAKSVLRRARAVYSRDRESLELAQSLCGKQSAKVRLVPDVAFLVSPREPAGFEAALGRQAATVGIRIGINVSGLLYSGGYRKGNMFDLKVDYAELLQEMVGHFAAREGSQVLLIPHVFPPPRFHVESDVCACLAVFERLGKALEKKVFLIDSELDQGEIKYVVGKCDFFLGSRMHSCIAALSQGIPAVGLAYSKKFRGCFDCVGVEDCVVDLRHYGNGQVMDQVRAIFARRDAIRSCLGQTIPKAKADVSGLFRDWS